MVELPRTLKEEVVYVTLLTREALAQVTKAEPMHLIVTYLSCLYSLSLYISIFFMLKLKNAHNNLHYNPYSRATIIRLICRFEDYSHFHMVHIYI